MNKLVLETPTMSRKGVYNALLAALESMVLCTVQKVVDSPVFTGKFSDTFIYHRGFITWVADLVSLEQQSLRTK